MFKEFRFNVKITKLNFCLLGAFFVKIVLLAIFSSNYQNQLFMPFVKHFLTNLGNPWDFFYNSASLVEFPNHPFMLYILSIFYLPVHLLGIKSIFIQNLFFKAPILISDILVTLTLFKIFPNRKKSILVFYVLSPIIIYSSYMHSQLDLIPTCLLFLAVYFLQKNKVIFSAVCAGLALNSKLHVIIVLPLFLIYLFKKKSIKDVFFFSGIIILLYSIISLPYAFSPGFYHLAIAGTKQKSIFNAIFMIGNLKVYLPIMGLLIIQGRFLTYPKINIDLLNSFIVLSLAIFVMLVPPAPGWYVWFFPFLSTLFISTYKTNRGILVFYFMLNFTYLLFFIFFYIPEFIDLVFIQTPINLKSQSTLLKNISFTMLESTLFLIIYTCYKFGVKSNTIYKKTGPLLIGIGGDSGSGKTTLLSDLKALLGKKLTVLEGDGYHKWERHNKNWNTFTHLNPKANWLHTQAENLMLLKAQKPVYRLDYDHGTGKFTQPKKINPNNFIALGGLHPFYLPKTRKIIDLKIYLEPSDQIRCHWKVVRDMNKRGYTKEKVLEQISKRKPDAQKYINPQKNFADLVVQYFAKDEEKNSSKEFGVNSKIMLNSNFKIDLLIKALTEEKVSFEWGYSDNLEHQYLMIQDYFDEKLLSKLAKQVIQNLDEIVITPIKWAPKYRGTMQFMTLFVLSEKMKEQDLCEI